MLIDYPWYTVLLCLLAGAVYAGAMYFVGRNRFAGWLRWLLTVLRFTAVTCIAALLLAPVVKRTVHEKQKPHVVLLQDRSLSVRNGVDSAFTLERVAAALDGRFRVTLTEFGNDHYTDIGGALALVNDDPADAIVLASDGIHNRGPHPTNTAERLSAPVHTILLGDTTPQRDAALTNLRAGRIASLGSRFPIEVTVNALMLRGQSAQLTVSDSKGRQLYREKIDYIEPTFTTTLTTTLPADEPGLQRFNIQLSTAEGEISTQNNSLAFYVDVLDTRRRVAIIANAAHPDLGALKRSIESNPNFEAEIILAEKAEGGKWKADDYSLAILHNLPSARHTDLHYADRLPKVYIIGLQTDLARFNSLHSGLEIVARASKTNQVTALQQDGFTLFHLSPSDATAIEAMPPLSAPFGEAKLSADLQTLFNSRLGNIDTRQPLIAATSQGELRRTFIWGEGLWRWRLADWQTSESHEHFDRLLSQIVSFTAMEQQRQRLQVEAARRYAVGEPIAISAQLYNENYELTNTPEAKIHLHGDSLDADYTFAREGSTYRLNLPPLSEGIYHYTATADGQSAEGSFAVEALGLEQRILTADHALLRSISTATGGQAYYTSQTDELTERLSALKPTIYTHTRYTEMTHMAWVLALIVLLLSAEWILRKYHGEL